MHQKGCRVGFVQQGRAYVQSHKAQQTLWCFAAAAAAAAAADLGQPQGLLVQARLCEHVYMTQGDGQGGEGVHHTTNVHLHQQ
eukprot:jgi/Chrzof1/10508/Cz05g01120.t1